MVISHSFRIYYYTVLFVKKIQFIQLKIITIRDVFIIFKYILTRYSLHRDDSIRNEESR